MSILDELAGYALERVQRAMKIIPAGSAVSCVNGFQPKLVWKFFTFSTSSFASASVGSHS